MNDSESSYLVWAVYKQAVSSGNWKLVKELQTELANQVPLINSMKGAITFLQEAPGAEKAAYWRHWCYNADLSGYSMDEMYKLTHSMLPILTAIAWAAFMCQADLSQYSKETRDKFRKKLPMDLIKAELEQAKRAIPVGRKELAGGCNG